jgi:hypothetical protein
MIDDDLAAMYKVETRRLNEQVKRNPNRFPKDFMFTLSQREYENLMSQNATSSWGGRRKLPNAFTEQGVATQLRETESGLELSLLNLLQTHRMLKIDPYR